MAGLGDSMEDANAAAYADCGESPPDDVVQECPHRTRGRMLLDKAKEKMAEARQGISEYKAAVNEKLKNLFSEDERAGLESMKNNVGVFPIFNAHGFMLDAMFHRINKEFGWDKKEDPPEQQPDAGR